MNKKIVKIIIIFGVIMVTCIIGIFVWININISKEQIPVLMYHQVIPEDLKTGETDVVSLENFEKQMKYLNDNGYKTLTLDEFLCWKNNECKIDKKSVLLTFDDGMYSVYYYAKPVLEKYNYTAAVFLITSTIPEKTNKFKKGKYGIIGYDVINSQQTTLEFASHTYNMHRMKDSKQIVYSMNYQEISDDLKKSNKKLDTKYLAYPYNTDTKDFRKALKDNGYQLAFRGESEKCVKSADNFQIPRKGVNDDFIDFKKIFETKKYNNRYGNGILRKIFVTIERKLK